MEEHNEAERLATRAGVEVLTKCSLLSVHCGSVHPVWSAVSGLGVHSIEGAVERCEQLWTLLGFPLLHF